MAVGINNITLSGRLARDAETREFSNSMKTSFSVAVEKSVKSGDKWETKVNYFDVEAWNMEWLKGSLTKGRQVVVSGELDTSEYTNKEGQKVRKVFVRADRIQTFHAPSERRKESNYGSSDFDDIP
ncbi:MAG: single-stranded DNA-binding protein [Spirochaetales bacterium]|nr:single-stranded DNA-binding protein [Spirochaetales bacterium]